MDPTNLTYAEPAAGGLGLAAPARARAAYGSLGIDVGAVSVKVCGLAADAIRHAVVPHEGDIETALDQAFAMLGLEDAEAPRTLTLAFNNTRREVRIEPLDVELMTV